MYFAGIDWAIEKHDICVQTAEGHVVSETTISHDRQGFQKLQARYTQHTGSMLSEFRQKEEQVEADKR